MPDVRKAVRWNTPFYGVGGAEIDVVADGEAEGGEGGWFVAYHCLTKYVKVTFFRGTSLLPVPPVASKQAEVRYFHFFEGDVTDEKQLAEWMRQAAALPGQAVF